MSKFKKGLTVDRDVEDPIRRPRPVSQEGYYYPEEPVYDKNSLHPNSRRQPMRQYGSSASLEVRHEHNRQQREREFFATSPSAIPKKASFENSRNAPMQSNFRNADTYQQSAGQTNNYQTFGDTRRLLPQNNMNPSEHLQSIPNSNYPPNSHSINNHNAHLNSLNVNQKSYRPNPSGFLPPQSHLSNNSRAPSLQHQIPPPDHRPNPKSQWPTQKPIRKDSLNSQDHSSNNQNSAKEARRLNLPDPVSIDDYISQAIKYHEEDQLEMSTKYFKIAAENGSAVGRVLYGLALRHGWGCEANFALAFEQLQQAAEPAIKILNGFNKAINRSSFRGELVLAIYELGVCFRHGWGIPKSKATAAHYFEIAANMGDPDAQNDIALCYYKGEGVKKDMKMAAKYYRMADAQGHGTMGNSWIFKEKYNIDN